MDIADDSKDFRSECKYDLRDPDNRFTPQHFDRVHREILIWSLQKDVPCKIARTPTGFTVTVPHPTEIAGAYGMSLFVHLQTEIFLELNAEGISLKYLDDVQTDPEGRFR